MTREELIAYDRWLTENKWGSSEIITPEQAADLYLAKHPLPPAEGAEKPNAMKFLSDNGYGSGFNYTTKQVANLMQEFAAQPQPPAEGAEAILKEGLDDGRYADITDGINIDVKQPFYQAIIRYAEDVVAAQPQPKLDPKKVQWSGYGELGNISQKPLQPTAEGAEEITAKEYLQNKYPQMRGHLWNSNEHINDDWIAEMMEGFATLHAQRIAEKMVEEKCKKCKHKGLPNSIQEALNSGDGVYRP